MLLIILCLFCISVTSCYPQSRSSNQIVEVIGGNLYLLGHERLTWFQAQQKCRQKMMHMFSPLSLQEYNNVLDHIITKYGTTRDYWIGANDLANEGSFRWSGNGAPLAFTFWRTGEPNNNNGDRSENCVCMVPRERRWNDDLCNVITHEYICS